MGVAFWLSMHVPYACRHAGACCSSGWPIPVEAVRVGDIQRLRADKHWLLPANGAPADVGGLLATRPDGHCVFHRRTSIAGRVFDCEIHDALGHDALPSACQHFPRQYLIDSRGVFVTLSHYCPTAAALLFAENGPVEIVAGPSPREGHEASEGLEGSEGHGGFDARDALPPLLTREMLMDHAGYSAWETHVIRTLAGEEPREQQLLPEQALDRLEEHAHVLQRWRPGRTTLAEAVRELPPIATAPDADSDVDWTGERELVEIARASLVESQQWDDIPQHSAHVWQTLVAPAWAQQSRVIRRLLAAHAFASWMAYQGTGVLSLIERLRLALAVLRIEIIRACGTVGSILTTTQLKHAIRQTDLLLLHVTQRDELAKRLSCRTA